MDSPQEHINNILELVSLVPDKSFKDFLHN